MIYRRDRYAQSFLLVMRRKQEKRNDLKVHSLGGLCRPCSRYVKKLYLGQAKGT